MVECAILSSQPWRSRSGSVARASRSRSEPPRWGCRPRAVSVRKPPAGLRAEGGLGQEASGRSSGRGRSRSGSLRQVFRPRAVSVRKPPTGLSTESGLGQKTSDRPFDRERSRSEDLRQAFRPRAGSVRRPPTGLSTESVSSERAFDHVTCPPPGATRLPATWIHPQPEPAGRMEEQPTPPRGAFTPRRRCRWRCDSRSTTRASAKTAVVARWVTVG